MTTAQIILLILILLLLFSVPWAGYHSFGYGPPGVLGTLVVVLIVLLLLGKI